MISGTCFGLYQGQCLKRVGEMFRKSLGKGRRIKRGGGEESTANGAAGKGGEPSLSDIMFAVQTGNENVNQKFIAIQIQIGKLQSDMAQLRADMVTAEQFNALEIYVDVLESQSVSNASTSPRLCSCVGN